MKNSTFLVAIIIGVAYASAAVTGTSSYGFESHLFQCPYPDGYFANPNNCAGFIRCAFDVPYYYDCPVTLLFNAQMRLCDVPANVDCGDRPIPTA